jgi:hypothetical protein
MTVDLVHRLLGWALVLLGLAVVLWLLVTLVVPVLVARRRGTARGGELLRHLYMVPADPVDWALRGVAGGRPIVAGWVERARAHALRDGWLPWRAFGALLALVLWGGALWLQLRLDSQMITLLDPSEPGPEQGGFGFAANARLITALLVMANTVTGLVCTDLLGLTSLMPVTVAGRGRRWAIGVVGVAFSGLLVLQGAVGAGRAASVHAAATRRADALEASARALRAAAPGDPAAAEQAATYDQDASARHREATRKRGLNTVVSVVLPALAAAVEAITSWALAVLVGLAVLLAACGARLAHALVAGLLTLGRQLLNRAATVHLALMTSILGTDSDQRPAGGGFAPPATSTTESGRPNQDGDDRRRDGLLDSPMTGEGRGTADNGAGSPTDGGAHTTGQDGGPVAPPTTERRWASFGLGR